MKLEQHPLLKDDTTKKRKGRPKGSLNKRTIERKEDQKLSKLQEAREHHRQEAEESFVRFIEIVQPKRLLGNIHREVISWWTRQEARTHQLLLLPRDHMKSALIGLRAAWEITRNPAIRILYISSTSNLAVKQLKFIKDILTCPQYRLLWPEMIFPEEARREKWTEREISVDHPKRREEYIREPTVFTAGLTTNIVGLHCDVAILDDVVVEDNAYTDEGRDKVKSQYSYLSSVEGANAREWVVGTRYHPNDLYSELISMPLDEYDETGELIGTSNVFEVEEKQVENMGDGTGEFLWPRQQRGDGAWFGFDAKILATKRAQYLNKSHFRAQYYNDPHNVGEAPIQRDKFQYYDPNFLGCKDGRWFYRTSRLNVFAAVDFAYTIGKKSDFSAIVVVGCDNFNNYYVLEIDRFKTNQHSEYYKRILKLYEKWGFRKIRAEVSGAQISIVNDLKNNYIRMNGLALSVEEYRPSRIQGSKEERINAILQPRYENGQMWHYPSGNCQILEEELVYMNPPHDDVKDALASVVDMAIPPTNFFSMSRGLAPEFSFHQKFGGVL
jgi:phage terminase large subunit-like protein